MAKKIILLIAICLVSLFATGSVFATQNPTVNAGPDLYLTSGQITTFQGAGYDPNGSLLNYSWACTGGSLSNSNILQPVYTAPYVSDFNNTNYTCTLTVTNTSGGSASDSRTIYMNYNNNGSNSADEYVRTNSATNISNYQATLNGNIPSTSSYAYYSNYAYFQWGTTTSYGSQTNSQYLGDPGLFSQTITNLNPNTTYHFRAVSKGDYGTVYGQDMTFYTSVSGYGVLGVSKQVIDLTSKTADWQVSVNANPSDILSFAITLQAGNQDVHNVTIRDILPANLIYKGNLTVNTNSNYGGDIAAGINIGTVYANQAIVVAYQAQVASAGNFSYGSTAINNNATVTSSEALPQIASATVIVNKVLVYGATAVSTGLTNNFLTDSFLLPLLLIIFGLWFYFSGEVYVFADKIKSVIKK